MTPEQAKRYLKSIGEFQADPMQLLAELEVIRSKSVEGYQQEKASAKGDVVVVTEIDMRTAVQAIRVTWGIVKDLYDIASEGAPEDRDYQFELHVITGPQGETGGTKENDTD